MDSQVIHYDFNLQDINFWGSVYCTQFAIPHLRKGKGKIIVMSSSGTWFTPPRMSFYSVRNHLYYA